MRVLMLAPWRAAIIQRLVAALENEGVEVILASHNAAGQKGVIDLGPLNSFWDYFKAGKVKKLIVEHKPDLIHAHYATHYGVMAALQWKVPFVQALWGNDVLYEPLNLGKGRVAFLRFLLRFVVRRAALCHSSSQQVCNEAIKIAGLKGNGNFQSWFWGIIPGQLRNKPLAEEVAALKSEYNLPEEIILSGRGLAEIYRPKEIAEIIRRCSQAVIQKKARFVILRATASNQDVDDFKQRLTGLEDAYILVNRMLNEKELAYLYHSSLAHLSIPLSDSLGGGVVEPAICGSYPILSDLPGNRWFAENYIGSVLLEERTALVNRAVEVIHKRLEGESLQDGEAYRRVGKDFCADAVIRKVVSMYSGATRYNL